MGSMPTYALLLVFVAGGIVTWVAGVRLSSTTDVLDTRFGLGEAMGGVVLLAVAGSLPEVAITVSAASSGHFGLASGNLIGGIAVQTVVLALCDAFASRDRPLSFLAGSLIPVFEALLAIAVVAITVAGGLLRPSTSIGGVVSPASVAIVVLWVGGLFVLNRMRKDPRWELHAKSAHPGRPHRRVAHPTAPVPFAGVSTARVATEFAICSLLILAAGYVLADSGNLLAGRASIDGVIFGATILAVVTALPEISSGLAAVKLGDYQLTFGDMFGGNAFQVCLFLVADLVAGSPVLPHQGAANSWLGGVGIVLTAVYAAGIISRPNRCFWRLGMDSWTVLILYALGIVGLIAVAA